MVVSQVLEIFNNHNTSHSDEGRVEPQNRIRLSIPFWAALVSMVGFLCASLLINQLLLDGDVSAIFTWKTALHVTKEFFFASVIALFIILTIELVSRSEQVGFIKSATHSIQNSVFGAVYKTRMNSAIFDEVEETIFTHPFVREDHERSMVLNPIEGNNEQLLMTIRQTYTVRNVTDRQQETGPTFYIPLTNSKHHKLSKIVSLKVKGLHGKCTIPEEYSALFSSNKETDDALKSYSTVSRSGAEDIYTFPKIGMEHEALLQISLEMHLVKDISDNEILTFLSPTLKGKFSIRSKVKGLHLNAINLHRGTLEPSISNSSMNKSWEITKPMLPHQGYVVFWRRKTK